MMAAQEFDGMKEQLDLEQSLRVKAETYAHEVKNQHPSQTHFNPETEEPEILEEPFENFKLCSCYRKSGAVTSWLH